MFTDVRCLFLLPVCWEGYIAVFTSASAPDSSVVSAPKLTVASVLWSVGFFWKKGDIYEKMKRSYENAGYDVGFIFGMDSCDSP